MMSSCSTSLFGVRVGVRRVSGSVSKLGIFSFKFTLLKIRVSLQASVVEFAETRTMVVGERCWAKSILPPGHAIAPLLAEKSIPQRCAIACRCEGKDFSQREGTKPFLSINGVAVSRLAEHKFHFAGDGGIVPRKAMARYRLKAGQVVDGLAFSFWAVRSDCQVCASVL